MLRWRLISAATIISVLLFFTWLDFSYNGGRPGIWLAPIGLAIAFLALQEVMQMLRAQGIRPVNWAVSLGTLLVVLFSCSAIFSPATSAANWSHRLVLGLVIGIFIVLWSEVARYDGKGRGSTNLVFGIFVVVYIGLLIGFLVGLRIFHNNAWGMVALMSMIIVAKLSDSGAYGVGRLIGRHKMTPVLSPKKTIEGAIGGLAFACLASWLVFVYLVPALVGPDSPRTPFWASQLYGLTVAGAGMLGDLVESLLKRDSDCKDSSAWMPGLGGVMDIMDSILLATPAAYFCWFFGLVGP